ncbi:asparagine synthase (glutamine-hydrolyzing) [Candidatus Omnitrophota bacterium]
MCGICGIYSPERYKEEAGYLSRMHSLLLHRGPDSQGIYESDHVGLAASRLSIVDIINSDQPLFNEDKSLVLVYNGMIYNFKELRSELESKGHLFRTKGDGEVIVHLYEEKGVECFNLLHGMFAMCIFDVKRNVLTLARDHFGIKPLYFYRNSCRFMFSSETRSLIKSGAVTEDIDPEGLNLYFHYNYIPGKRTIYKDLFELLPGHFLQVNNHLRPVVRSFWRPNIYTGKEKFSAREIIHDVEELMKDSIKRHIQSDVEVGCFLSGGIDSSSIVHFLCQNNHRRLKTFSVGYDNKSYDERPYARLVAEKYKTDHAEIVCREGDVIRFLEDLPEICDSVIADQACVSTYLVSRLASKYVKVCLSGEGGDELFLGYPTYRADFLYRFFKHLPIAGLGSLEKMISFFPSSDKKLNFDYKFLRFIQGAKFRDSKMAHSYWRVIFPFEDKKAILKSDLLDKIDLNSFSDTYYGGPDKKDASLEYLANSDLTSWLTFNNLLRTDVYSMKNSLEVRVPFLYLPLAEYLIKLPFSARFKITESKYLLKKIMTDKLDQRILRQKKQGWHMPIAAWLKSDLFDYCHDIFNAHHRLFDNFINRDECINLLLRHRQRKENNSFKIWGLLVLLKHISP